MARNRWPVVGNGSAHSAVSETKMLRVPCAGESPYTLRVCATVTRGLIGIAGERLILRVGHKTELGRDPSVS